MNLQTKNSGATSLPSKNSGTAKLRLRRGRDQKLETMENLTFEDGATPDGGTLEEELTIAQLSEQSWTLQNKN